ncbi:MAG: CHAT domain-containing protein [Gemmataceae bacterium]
MLAGSSLYDMTLSLDPSVSPATYSALLSLPGHVTVRGDRAVHLPVDALSQLEQLVLCPRPQARGLGREMTALLGPMRDAWQHLTPRLQELEQVLADGINVAGMSPHLIHRLQESLGTLLFEAIFQGPLHTAYQQAYTQARQHHAGLHLRLQLHESLQNLPFELLYDPDHRLFLAANIFTTLVRSTPGIAVSGPEIKYPLRLLVVIASPVDAPPLGAELELERLRAGLDHLLKLGIWKMEVIAGPDTLRQIATMPDRASYDVLHFIGHGIADSSTGRQGLILEGTGRRQQIAESRDLLPVLAGLSRLRLVVLNACHGGRELSASPFSSIAHQLLRPEVPAVVAMQRQIGDRSAILFTEHLYRSLARCRSIGEAVNAARTELLTLREPVEALLDWFNPQVFLRSPDGRLFSSAEGASSIDRHVETLRNQGDLQTALAVYEATAEWNSPTLGRRLAELGSHIFDEQDWKVLARLVTVCEQHQIALDSLEMSRWKRSARLRQTWLEERLPRMRQALEQARGGSLVTLSRAVHECDRLIVGLSRNQEDVLGELYGGDRKLRDRCLLSDLDRINAIRDLYKGPTLSPWLLDVFDLLEQIETNHGVPVKVPLALMRNETAELFFVHPIANRARLAQAREALLQRGGDRPGNDWIASLSNELGIDLALVYRAAGQHERAIALWMEEGLTDPGRSRLLELCHHLALVRFPLRSREELPSTSPWSERALAPWAVLLAGDPDDFHSYWQQWTRQHSQEARQLGGLEGPLVRALVSWLEVELAETGMRELEVVESPLLHWLECELAIIRRLEATARQAGMAPLLLLGPSCLNHLGFIADLLRLYHSCRARTGIPVERWVELRMVFSSLYAAWEALVVGASIVEVLGHLEGLACSSCQPREASPPKICYQQRGPCQVVVPGCHPHCPAFHERNPLHARLPDGEVIFQIDLERLLRSLFLREACHIIEHDESRLDLYRELLATVPATQRRLATLTAALAEGDPLDDEDRALVERDWNRLVARLRHQVDQAGQQPTIEQSERLLLLLRPVFEISNSEELRSLLVDQLLLYSRSLLEAKSLEPVLATLTEAVNLEPARHDVHELLLHGLLCKAEVQLEHGQLKLAWSHLEAFEHALADAGEMFSKRDEFLDRATRLRRELEQPEKTTVDLSFGELEASIEESVGYRLEQTDTAIQAFHHGSGSLEEILAYMNEAALIAGANVKLRAAVVLRYELLFERMTTIGDQQRVLRQALEHFPERDDFQQHLNALELI